MINVIVVPETDDFKEHVSHESVVWINKNIGIPRIKDNNAKYLAPYWITDKFRGVNRVFHILDHYKCENGTYEIILGNSFVIDKAWDKMGNPRKFEYHKLKDFGFEEIKDGLLLKV
jgi:hypothetical protein